MWVAKNDNLQKALCLRREGNLVDARKYLELACEENDPDALYFMGRSLADGGFGIKKQDISNGHAFDYYVKAGRLGHVPSLVCMINSVKFPSEMSEYYMSSTDPCKLEQRAQFEEGYVILRDAAISGNIFALLRLVDYYEKQSDEMYVRCLQIGAGFGDGWAQFRHYRNSTNTEWLLKGGSQMNFWCMHETSQYYRKQRNLRLAVYFEMENNMIHSMDSSFLRVHFQQEDSHAIYEYGRWACLSSGVSKEHLKPHFAHAWNLYVTSNDACQAAVLYFLWMTKYWLVPDLRRFIGKMIWESRVFPQVWIENKKEIIKKQKL
jgi:TPR repeat protein